MVVISSHDMSWFEVWYHVSHRIAAHICQKTLLGNSAYPDIMLILGDMELAKYPFLADAGRYLRDSGFSLEQLGSDPDLNKIRKKAFERIQIAVQEGKVYKDTIQSGKDLPLEVLSFLLAIVLLKLSGARYLVRKFAMQEARRAESILERDLGRAITDDQVNLTSRIIHDLAGIHIRKQEQFFIIPVPDYLSRAVRFHATEWKLINRTVDSGMVYLTPHQTVRLIRQEISGYIDTKIAESATPSMAPGLEKFVDRISSINAEFRPRMVKSGALPPCVIHAIETLKSGQNLSHSGRFLLATYMFAQGQDIADIASYFKTAPDYNESITMYQLRQISGKSGRGVAYLCQSCSKLKTLDLCYATSECDHITNPLQFGTRR